MSQTIYTADNGVVMLTQFGGGASRGRCFQITVADHFVQLTETQMDAVAAAYIRHRIGDAGHRHHEQAERDSR